MNPYIINCVFLLVDLAEMLVRIFAVTTTDHSDVMKGLVGVFTVVHVNCYCQNRDRGQPSKEYVNVIAKDWLSIG